MSSTTLLARLRHAALPILLPSLPAVLLAQPKVCARTAPGAIAVSGVVASGAVSGGCTANAAWAAVAPLALSAAPTPSGNFTAAGTIRLTRSGTHLYVGFTVADDGDFSDLDQAVIVFDKENDGAWNDGDFYVRVQVGPAAQIVSPSGGSSCNRSTVVEVYRFAVGDGFVKDNGPFAGTIGAKAAIDYETATDAETNLWNLEVDVPTNNATTPITLANFAVGAYLYLDYGHFASGQVGNVLRWPDAIGDRPLRLIPDLEAIPASSFPAVSAANLADANANDVCFNVTFAGVSTPLEVNNTGKIIRNQPNTFKVWYFVDGPGSAVTSGPNPGTVKLQIHKYTAGWQPAWNESKPVTPDTYNQNHSASFTMPANTIPNNNTVTDACSDLYLENFQFDDDKTSASNHHHVNHIPINTSEYVQDVELGVDSVPMAGGGTPSSILLQLTSTNDPQSKPLGVSDAGGSRRIGAPGLVAGGALAFAFAVAARRRRVLALLLAVVGTAAVLQGCRRRPPEVPPIGTDRWQFENAGELGLTPLPNEPGWYRMPIQRGEAKRARLRFVGRPLPYTTTTDSLAMAFDSATNAPVARTIAVQPGQVVTVLTFGRVDVDGPNGPLEPVTAGGLIRADSAGAAGRVVRAAAADQYPLDRGRYVGAENVGALIGSFDGMRTTFVVGTIASIVVPKGAQQLTLTTNGRRADYARATGKFELKWVVSAAPSVPTATSFAFDTPFDQPSIVAPWLVLTAMHMKTFYEVPVRVGEVMRTGRQAIGEAHITIYESHVQ